MVVIITTCTLVLALVKEGRLIFHKCFSKGYEFGLIRLIMPLIRTDTMDK